MGATNPEGRITRRGFLECGSAALTSVGLIGNAYAAMALLSSESILDNAKPNFQRLATLVAERLQDEHSLAGIAYFRKENPAVGADPKLLDQIAASADLVLTGSAD